MSDGFRNKKDKRKKEKLEEDIEIAKLVLAILLMAEENDGEIFIKDIYIKLGMDW